MTGPPLGACPWDFKDNIQLTINTISDMKRTLLVTFLLMMTLGVFADNAAEAKKVLDKTASAINAKNGAQASFQLSGEKLGHTAGTIAIKGSKFHAKTPQATVWFDGTTQWTYMKKTDEVNVTTPTRAQQAQMNPLTFINMYKSGYKLSMQTVDGKYEVRMQAESSSSSIQEMYVVINKTTYVPSQVRVRQKSSWMTINITNFKATAQSDNVFTFKKSDCPSAEIVDLR